VGGIVAAAIAPHGGIAIPELCAERELDLAVATRAGMEELGRRFQTARPEAAIVLTPHGVQVEGAMAVVVAGRLEGVVGGEEGRSIQLACPVDLELAVASLLALTHTGIPTVGVTCGEDDPAAATMPMDWGALIPLWFMGGRSEPPLPVVLVSPARDLPPEVHVAAGRVLAAVAEAAGRRVALIASADHGHGHDEGGPYGFHPASAEYDELVVELVRENRLEGLLQIDPAFVDIAQADSFWQMLVLHGATNGGFDADLLSYEAPTYFGMMCAAFTPRASSA
jgi:aromatic ring-opening dioxygenase LigB subunit